MHILLVADGRSPTTRRWVEAVLSLGHQITLISTFPFTRLPGVEADITLPVAFSGLAGSGAGAANARPANAGPARARKLVAGFRSLFLAGRYRLGPLTLRYYGPRLRWLVERIQPDLVHALRIPFEGMLASYTPPGIPVIVSTWGNDLTLHAPGSSGMAALTRATLARADGLLADTYRDIRLARAWGLAQDKPAQVVPGNGGLNLDELYTIRDQVQAGTPPPGSASTPGGLNLDELYAIRDQVQAGVPSLGSASTPGEPNLEALYAALAAGAPLVINPRGFRTGSVRQDTFFEAIPLVFERWQRTVGSGGPPPVFACAAMAGQREALQWVDRLKLGSQVVLLPHLPQAELWRLFARATVTVSVSQHDGTPNSLLEALALGVFPVAGDIESIREWITPGVNGLLVEPGSPQQLAEALLLALADTALRQQAAACNARLIAQRAAPGVVRAQIEAFYQSFLPG